MGTSSDDKAVSFSLPESLRKTIKASAVEIANLLHEHCAVKFGAYTSLGTVTRLRAG
jgi:hypothetical protein